MSGPSPDDLERMDAAMQMIGRAGAQNLEFGYANEDAKRLEDGDWWATCQFRGNMLMVEHHISPVHAVEALAQIAMRDAKCRYCARPIGWGIGPNAGETRCPWKLVDGRWVRGCTETHTEVDPQFTPGEVHMMPEAEPVQRISGTELPPKVEGQHRWVTTVAYTLTEDEVTTAMTQEKEKVMLDERRRLWVATGCFDCEEVWEKAHGQPCPAGDTWTVEHG
jgi:hypothetical protein